MIRFAWLADVLGIREQIPSSFEMTLTPYTEDDSPTEECSPPTLPSPVSADTAIELANEAADAHDFETAKAWMQFANHACRRFPL